MKTTKKDSCPGQHSAPAPLTLRQDYYCVVWTCHSLFNHSPICGQLGSSQHCGITMPQWRTMFSIYFQSIGGVSSRPILMRETAQFESSRPGLWGTAKSDSTSSVSQCLSLHGLVNRRCYKNLYQSKKWEMVTCCWVFFISFFWPTVQPCIFPYCSINCLIFCPLIFKKSYMKRILTPCGICFKYYTILKKID